MKKVSIIIPVYNNEKYVERCIRSVLNQTFYNLEIIIINDGSTDDSCKILNSLAEEDERIILIQQKNCGVACARNRGVESASGEYITFVDGDDYIAQDYIENLYSCAENEKAEIVICGLTYVEENGSIIKTILPGKYKRFEHEEWTFRISAVCSHLYKRQLWTEYNIKFQSGERGEDMPISLFFSAVCDKITTLHNVGYYYVQHPSSAMHNFQGLKNFSLPYCALENMIIKIRSVGVKNSYEFYELFVLRILATCFYELSPGASKEKMNELCNYIIRILDTYFCKYYKNRKACLFTPIDVPFIQKAAVLIFIILVKTRMIYPVSKIMAR